MERFLCGTNASLNPIWPYRLGAIPLYRGNLRVLRSVHVDLQALIASWRGFLQMQPSRLVHSSFVGLGEQVYESDLSEAAFNVMEPYFESGRPEHEGDVVPVGSAASEVPLACWLANANVIDPMKFMLHVRERLPAYCHDPWHIDMLIETLPSPDSYIELSKQLTESDDLDAVTGEIFDVAVHEAKISRLDFESLERVVADGTAPSILEASFRYGRCQDIVLPRLVSAMFGPGSMRLGPIVTRRVLKALGDSVW